MSESTLIAVIVLVGIFFMLALTIIKYGIDGAIKIWGLLGVGFGAIISFYFSNQVKNREVAAISAQSQAEVALINQKAATKLMSFKIEKESQDADLKKILADIKKNPSAPKAPELLQINIDKSMRLNRDFDSAISDFKHQSELVLPGLKSDSPTTMPKDVKIK
jgi:hypothetical protein